MKKVFGLFIILLLLILAACSTKQYIPISNDLDLIITINIKDSTISFIDAKERKNLERWKLDKPYSGGMLFPNGDTLLLYGKQLDTVDLYSLSSGRIISSWPVGKGIVNAYLLNNEEEIVFADQERNLARFFTLEGHEIVSVSTEAKPYTILEGEDRLYVLNISDDILNVINLKNKKKQDNINIHSYAAGALLLKEKNELWIGGHGLGTNVESNIHVYDSSNGSLINTYYAPMMPINFAEWNDHIFVLSHGSNTLYKLTKAGEQEKSIQIGANPFELLLYQHDLVVAGYDSNDIYFLNPINLEVIQKLNVGEGPFQMIVRER
ncbi:YncE family protein [Bacillus tuaregi]|uniref:YncE family protein n=1 Tax=Bacillus tuaregi TaxID=1816695 RepID=UPI001F2D24E8|nr:WD40 repeat domain-containing protein [Bacillus tuaregi]